VEDLVQEGSIGLMNAIDLFDPELGVRFTTYATHLVTGQIQHYLRDCGHLIRQPAWVQELNTKITRAANKLTQDFGRDPEPEEIGRELGLTAESVQEVLAARELKRVVSLSAPDGTNADNDFLLIDPEKIRSDRHTTLQLPIEDRIALEESIDKLKALEQKVVRMAFFSDMNQSEIARKLGISPHYSSYLLRRSLTRLKADATAQREQEAAMQAPPPTPVPKPHSGVPIYDKQTGLHTEVYLRTIVEDEIDRSLQLHFALILGELRGAPTDPERHRHLLLVVGRLLRDSVHSTDYVAHLGDNRFALMLPRTGREARVVAERLTILVAARRESLCPGCPDLGMVVGHAIFPADGVSLQRLFRHAEQALKAQAEASTTA
jgi:RNA polymerase sigma-B factor